MTEAPGTAPAQPDVDIEFVYDETAELDPPHDVIVHNDDVTPFDFVIHILESVFELPPADAYAVTLTAHLHGQALVATLPLEDAKFRVYRAHTAARAQGYPLRFSIHLA